MQIFSRIRENSRAESIHRIHRIHTRSVLISVSWNVYQLMSLQRKFPAGMGLNVIHAST